MSTDYDTILAIGYVIDLDDIPDKYRRHHDEQSHLEQRYDEKSGKRAGKVKVIDREACNVYIFDDKEFDDIEDFLAALAQACDGVAGAYGNFTCGDVDDIIYTIEPKIPDEECGGIRIAWLVEKNKAICDIGTKLKNLGFKVGEPRIYTFLNIS